MTVERAQALIEVKRFDEAIAELRALLAVNPYDSHVLVHLGFAQLFSADFAGCLETADLAISVDYQRHGLHGLRGNALARLGRYDDAYEAYERGLTLDVDSVAARVQYIESLLDDPRTMTQEGRSGLVRAAELSQAALELGPNVSVSHECDARIKALAGRYDDAEQAVRRALEIDPNTASALNLLAGIQKLQGKTGDARDSYVAASRVNPAATNTAGLDSLGDVAAPVDQRGSRRWLRRGRRQKA